MREPAKLMFFGNFLLTTFAYALLSTSPYSDVTTDPLETFSASHSPVFQDKVAKALTSLISSALAATVLTGFEALGRKLFHSPKEDDKVNALLFGEHRKRYVQGAVALTQIFLSANIYTGFAGTDEAAQQRNFFLFLVTAVAISVGTEFAEFIKAKWNGTFNATGRLTAREAFPYVLLAQVFVANVLLARQFIEAFPSVGDAIAKQAVPILGSSTPYVLPAILNTTLPFGAAIIETKIKDKLGSHQKKAGIHTPFGVFGIPRALGTIGVFYGLLCGANLELLASFNDPMLLLIAQIVVTFGITAVTPAAQKAFGVVWDKVSQFRAAPTATATESTGLLGDTVIITDKGDGTPPGGTPRHVSKSNNGCPNPFSICFGK